MGRFIDSSKSVQMLAEAGREKGRDSKSLHKTLTDLYIINKKFTKLGGKISNASLCKDLECFT